MDQSYNDVLYTYRYLRVAMPLLAVALGAAVAHQIYSVDPDCWLGSISAYYYTSARAVFVACLCAIGVALITYHGNSSREDIALNVSGFLAFIVAFIPTPLRDLEVKPGDALCRLSNVPTEGQFTQAIRNNILALLVGGTLMVLLICWFWLKAPARQHVGTLNTWAVFLSVVGIAVGWVVLWGQPVWARQHAHLWSAITLFAGIVLVILMNAWKLFRGSAPRPRPGYEGIYRGIAIAMVVVGIPLAVMALRHTFDNAVFWLELLGIAGFSLFWAVQTAELWDVISRGRTATPQPAPDAAAAQSSGTAGEDRA